MRDTTAFLILGAVIVAACFAIGWTVLYFLWNWIVPSVFHGPEITFWQAAGISLLLSLFGGVFRSVVTVKK